MVTKMVTTWRVNILYFILKLEGVWGQDCLSAVAKKQRRQREAIAIVFLSLKTLWIDGK